MDAPCIPAEKKRVQRRKKQNKNSNNARNDRS